MKNIAIACFAFLAVGAQAQVLPAPPQVWLNTCMPSTVNTITVCASGCDYTNTQLQQAFNNALPGTTILLESGYTYIGPYTLPVKSGDEWIVVRTNVPDAQLPDEDHRIDPSYAPVLAKIQGLPFQSALVFASGAHHYRVMDLEFNTQDYVYDIIVAGDGAETSAANVPHDLVFDRLYVHGHPTGGTKRGIRINSASTAVINCWISDCKAEGQDAQAVAGWNGPGPFKIVNNHLEGSGENFMLGGALAAIPGLIPADVEIRNNHFFKPLSWRIGDPDYEGTPWCIKNLFELKNAQRVWVEGNILENNWAHCQSGFAVLFTPRTEGVAMNNQVSDITWKHNILINSEGGFNISPHDDGLPNPPTSRLLLQDNLAYDINRNPNGGDGKMYQVLGDVHDLTIQHNTTINTGTGVISDAPPIVNGIFRDNITGFGGYGVCGSGLGCASAAIDSVWPGGNFTHNAFFGATPAEGGVEAWYPPFHWFPDSIIDVGFTDIASHNFALLSSSLFAQSATDGTALGADMDSVNTFTSGVLTGYWPNCVTVTTLNELPQRADFLLSPVPTRDVLTITARDASIRGQVGLLDVNGRILRTRMMQHGITNIPVHDLPSQPAIVVLETPSGARLLIGRALIL
jgi:hypothetical protein